MVTLVFVLGLMEYGTMHGIKKHCENRSGFQSSGFQEYGTWFGCSLIL